ncbi:hypothetical protein PR202_ga31393 [Eleusine coracana subsp. coracana]|uniref:Disease resistance R13L4/SHOC-2-like LRR domain-containing protein n=1 Tax=Eleusine coracana subsp. coracana TaxID=191504 RepID=A0AAV5DT21_ELECO|nr:hypothetical protein PR202_ga31393 [Eleusine coracana subsp. coracana]
MDYSKCRMHNLFWHLARHISRKECFSGDSKMVEFQHISNLRRITLITKKDMVVLPNLYTGKVKIRTLILSNIISARVDSAIFVKLPHLRVLDLSGSPIQQIPADVKCLIHLRLLNLDRTDIACIPECIGSLTNLQILNLQECYALFTLPMRLTCLCNLRRLGLSRTPITQFPKGIGRLTFLNDLEGFPLGHDCGNDKMQNGWDLRELEGLLLVKKLDIIKLERTIPCCAESLFIHKHHLKILSMRCTERQFHPSREEADWIEGVFEELVPPRNLEDLSIIGFFGRRYSSWLISHLPSVKFLKLVYCICWEQLPPLGQLPNMTFLKIKGAFSVNKIGHEFLGGGLPAVGSKMVAFPKLEVLIIEHMPYWEEWSLVEENKEGKRDDADSCHTVKERGPTRTGMLPFLPCLQRLELLECPKLRALPQQLAETTSLNQLLIRGANSLKVVKNLPYISGELRIDTCRSLKRVSNLPLLRCLYISGCPALRVVDKFGNLQLLGLSKHILDRSSLWLSDLQHEYRQLQGKDLRIITWDPTLVIKL